jgi:membrane-associated phospholipid phosphatase
MHDGNRSLGNVHRRGGAAKRDLKTSGSLLREKAMASAGLSLLFVVVYGGCIWITLRRHDVGVFYFEWERQIPFVAFFVLPYMSIDLFFVAAPFFLPNENELKLFVRRVTAAITVAGSCFLLFPLRFAFPRSRGSGWLGATFEWFRGLDAPFNLFPSLHAALCLLLLQVYARHLRGALRAATIFWFVLIGLSPLLTHQHHLIDIGGGFALAIGCFLGLRPQNYLAGDDAIRA